MATQFLVVHDSAIIREGLRSILRQEGWQVSMLSSPEQLVAIQPAKAVELIVLADASNPPTEGMLSALRKHHQVYQIALCAHAGEEAGQAAFYHHTLSLATPAATIIERLTPFIDSATEGDPEGEALSTREKEVLRLVATGKTNKEIADQLFISIHTVISHRKNITEKLGIKSISGLTVYAIINKLIDTDRLHPGQLI